MSDPILLLYDGVCGLCNRLVQFVLRRDPAAMFRFASLQSALAASILARHGVNAGDLDTVCVVVDAELAGERLLIRSDAVIFILRQLGAAELRSAHPDLRPGPTQATTEPAIEPARNTRGSSFWRLLAVMLQLMPRWLRDWGYGVVARNRYRVFGRYDTCPLPTEETSWRFLDLD
jgi:predicted DCC family thiol-disulfide oxidoreductase YuxK